MGQYLSQLFTPMWPAVGIVLASGAVTMFSFFVLVCICQLVSNLFECNFCGFLPSKWSSDEDERQSRPSPQVRIVNQEGRQELRSGRSPVVSRQPSVTPSAESSVSGGQRSSRGSSASGDNSSASWVTVTSSPGSARLVRDRKYRRVGVASASSPPPPYRPSPAAHPEQPLAGGLTYDQAVLMAEGVKKIRDALAESASQRSTSAASHSDRPAKLTYID